MKKKRNNVQPPQITEKAQIYLDLWIALNKSHEEKEIDEIRKQMTLQWSQMDQGDIKLFKLFADEIEAKTVRNTKFTSRR